MAQFDSRIDVERLQLALYTVIYRNINSYVVAEQKASVALDEKLAEIRQTPVTPVVLEQFEPRNIHYGHKPSMIEQPIERFPTLSVMAWTASQSAFNMQMSAGFNVQIGATVEAIVRSDPLPMNGSQDEFGEEQVGKRIKRTMEAINQIISDNPSLDGEFMPSDQPPRVIFGDIFEREGDDPKNATNRYMWQGVRMEYAFTKQLFTYNIDQ